jgi:spermidine/putrescine-binding protein
MVGCLRENRKHHTASLPRGIVKYLPASCLRRGGRPVEDWGDLLQPKLEGRVAWADSPREFVGAALRTLGMHFNSSAAELAAAAVSEAALAAAVAALRKQVPHAALTHMPE